MDPRTAAHALNQIGDLLELSGENRFKSRAYRVAARTLLSVEADDLRPLYRSGELASMPGLGPATLAVLGELLETGESSYLERLRTSTPSGLVEMMRIPGLATQKIQLLHQALGIDSVGSLEQAARDGRLAGVKGFGPKTAEKILEGIAYLSETGAYVRYPVALDEARRLLAAVTHHPDVAHASIAGSIRRRREIIRDIDIVAACTSRPEDVAASFTRAPGVRGASGAGERSVTIRFVDGTTLDLHCVEPHGFGFALWRATGSAEHERDLRAYASRRGFGLGEHELRDARGSTVSTPDEADVYAALGLPFIEPELREGLGEIAAAARHELPTLIEAQDIRGVLHCHSTYSDGKATIAEMAAAAQAHGWSYLGISDHSQSAFYAGGMSPSAVRAQHEEIDGLNAALTGFRVLKGIEADILADGRIDYQPELLDRFDYVIGSVHSRFTMDEATMTARVLAALDDPHLTILGHPTGRLLLTRAGYPIDMQAVLAKAAVAGVAVELNADAHRLDLDWRLCRTAKQLGVAIEIGPDAHSSRGLDNMGVGVGIARKGWLEAADVLNARDAESVLAFAARRRESGR